MIPQTSNKFNHHHQHYHPSYSSPYTIMVEQLKNSYSISSPGNRMNHIITYYNDQIFIIGGTSASNTNQDQHYRVVYWYSLSNKLWNKKQFCHLIRNQEKDKDRQKDKERQKQQQRLYKINLITRSSMASCQKQHKLYIFGGADNRNQCNNDLLIFDMKKYQWQFPKNESPPQPRQSAQLFPFLDNYLLLYGGINFTQIQIYQYFHYYNLQTGIWKQVEQGNYRYILKPRYQAGMCYIDNKIYIFGGQYRNVQGIHQYLSDFYQLTVNLVTINNNKTNSLFHFDIQIDCQLIKQYNTNNVLNVSNEIIDENNEQIEKDKSKSKQKQKQYQRYKDKDKNKMQEELHVGPEQNAGIINARTRSQRNNKNNSQMISENADKDANGKVWPSLVSSNANNNNNTELSSSKTKGNISITSNNIINTTQNQIPSSTPNIPLTMSTSDRKFPQPKSGHKLLPINKQYLILIGGRNIEQFYLCNAWIYHITNKIWKKIQLNISIQKTLGINCCVAESQGKDDGKDKDKIKNKEKQKQIVLTTNKRQTHRERNKQKGQRQERGQKVVKSRQRQQLSDHHDSLYNVVYVYGGLNCYDSVKCDLYRLRFDTNLTRQQSQQQSQMDIENTEHPKIHQGNQTQLEKPVKSLQSIFRLQPLKQCNYCNYPHEPIYLSKQIIQDFTSMISFPFNAIGLLLENAYHNSSSQFCIMHRNQIYETASLTLLNLINPINPLQYRLDTQIKQSISKLPTKLLQIINTPYFLHILQNNNLKNVSYQNLKSAICNFQYALHFTYHNIQKKIKISLQKEHQLKQYGVYLKIAALRLGNQFIYLSKGNHGQMRIFAFLLNSHPKKKDEEMQADEQYYQFCSYVYDGQNRKIIQFSDSQVPNQSNTQVSYFSTYSYQKINKKYKKYLEDIFVRYSLQANYNHLLIFNLKQIHKKLGQSIPELIPLFDTVDICYSPYQKQATNHGRMLNQAIDVSLRTYLSLYFLKGQFPQMFILINNKQKQINTQMCLQAFDIMTKKKSIYEIDSSIINSQIKLMEIYYNPELYNPYLFANTRSFHNGILFYHKDRLVTRHECPLGDLYTRVTPSKYNYFHLFGVLEVPQAIRPNIFRTDFIFNVMMEKLRSRLKFIEKKLILQFKNSLNNEPHILEIIGINSRERNTKNTKKTSLMKEREKRQREGKVKEKKDDFEFHPHKRE